MIEFNADQVPVVALKLGPLINSFSAPTTVVFSLGVKQRSKSTNYFVSMFKV